jgi:hypothetical protein
MVDGDFLVDYAWKARGSGLAKTVTPEGGKLFEERIAQAHKRLVRAHELAPDRPEAATVMIAVAMASGMDRAHMEVWFTRAMEADPDNINACLAKITYLQPKWHGSLDEVVDFADQCLRTKNWSSYIPLTAAAGVTDLYQCFPREVFRGTISHPLIWNRVEAAYNGMLAAYPDDRSTRTMYAVWCSRAGQWKLAKEQFDTLGDNVWLERFKNKEEWQNMVRIVRKNAEGK